MSPKPSRFLQSPLPQLVRAKRAVISLDSAATLRLALVLAIALLAGCRQEMDDQPRLDPLEPSEFFEDGSATRPLPPHTVATASPLRELPLEEHQRETRSEVSDSSPLGQVPGAVREQQTPLQLLKRGHDRFEIYCAPCHGLTGQGDGMVARRGFPFPPSYHTRRLREKEISYFFAVITHGHGQMPSYGEQLSERDRWAIAGYVRALQLSQYAPAEMLEPAEQQRLEEDHE